MRYGIALLLAFGVVACEQATIDPRSLLSRDQLDQVEEPLLLAEIPDMNVAATLVVQSERGDVRTWITGDQVSLAFSDGVLVGTRGLGQDLMSADVTRTRQVLNGAPGTSYYLRFHSYLDGENQTVFRSFQCRVTAMKDEIVTLFERRYTTRMIEETCNTPDIAVVNRFWQGRGGILWKSRQWVSPGVGYLETERLVR